MKQKHFYAIVKSQNFFVFPAGTFVALSHPESLLGSVKKIDILGTGESHWLATSDS